MNAGSERRLLDGAAGAIEIALDWPANDTLKNGLLRGLACIGHPHPLYGGTLDNKVAATMARAYCSAGWLAVRPNFRGVGRSAGSHDGGTGETADFLRVFKEMPQYGDVAARLPHAAPRALAGFSFGSFVAAQASAALHAAGAPPDHLVLVGAAAGKWPLPAVPPNTLVIHGEMDETIPLSDVFEWARPMSLPVIVIPGVDHFFHRHLTVLKNLITQRLRNGGPRENLSAE